MYLGQFSMRALILAAGLGTRLLPYTKYNPKPLFTIAGRPLLDIIIRRLIDSGCESIIVNTHHLHQQIESFISRQGYSIPVHARFEPQILGTGGAIQNVHEFWDARPFIVINADVYTDIDLRTVYNFHCHHHHPATLVLCDDPEFNTVSVDPKGFITAFQPAADTSGPHLTFTGVQVLDPSILDYIPKDQFSSSIDAFQSMLVDNKKVKAFIIEYGFWNDIGTPDRYTRIAVEESGKQAFKRAFPDYVTQPVTARKLKGDGSDRKWYRLFSGNHHLIMADHGLRTGTEVAEVDSFVQIGNHLRQGKLPVPKIFFYDTFAGIVFMEDLGDTNLQDVVLGTTDTVTVENKYKTVIDLLIRMSTRGLLDFDASWTYQTRRYTKDLILEKECQYFVEAFLNGYLGMDISFDDFKSEFSLLAEMALANEVRGFMHRDLQSRNVMVAPSGVYFIDFQGGRIGPLQYDLASLLIDPYVSLPVTLQEKLLEYCTTTLSNLTPIDQNLFRQGYQYCALTRNLQMLGAFGYLSNVKGKKHFEKYIPTAVSTLNQNLKRYNMAHLPSLTALITQIVEINPAFQ